MHVSRLVKKAKKGNKEALLQLIMAKKDEYYRLSFSYMGNEQDAMDAMEDMIVTLYEKINQLKKAASFYSWSKTILVNCCKTMLTKRKKIVLVDEWINNPSIQHDPSSMDALLQREQQMDLQQLLAQLNDNQAEAIALKYFHDLDYSTIADITNVPIGTVKSRVFQGLKKMSSLYRGDNDA